MLALEKRHLTSMSIFADDAVHPDLEDETFHAMCSIRKEFGKSVKTYCEEVFLNAFNTSPISRALTRDVSQKTARAVSDLKKHIKNLVDRKGNLKEARLIFLKVDTRMNFLNM